MDESSRLTPSDSFAIPHRVYSELLAIEGHAPHTLDFGIFPQTDPDVALAARYAIELIQAHLPPPTARILVVGSGFDTVLADRLKTNYDVVEISAGTAQECTRDDRSAEGVKETCLEDLIDSRGFDVAIFLEAAHRIDPLNLFTACRHRLRDGARLLIVDEFALRREEPGPENLHLLDHFLRLAERFGFKVETQLDLSARAAPTLDVLLSLLITHRERLINDGHLDGATIDALATAHRTRRARYATGRYGYALVKLIMGKEPRWLPGLVHEGNRAEMLSLFREVFGHDMTPEHWQWKYGEGRGTAIGVWQEGRLIAHYGAISRPVSFAGRPTTLMQPCDVMVHPGARGALVRNGPFFLAAATLVERNVGYGTRHLLPMGFPNPRAKRLPERLGIYAGETGHMMEVQWLTLPCRRHLTTKVRPIDAGTPGAAELADQQWDRMAADLSDAVVVPRTWSYLKYRYLEHPTKDYAIYGLWNRLSGRCRGLFVLGREGDRSELLDVVGSLAEIPQLIRAARRMAGCSGLRTLFCWIVDNHQHRFAIDGAVVHDLHIPIPYNNWTDGPPLDDVKGRWWLTSGDTDFH